MQLTLPRGSLFQYFSGHQGPRSCFILFLPPGFLLPTVLHLFPPVLSELNLDAISAGPPAPPFPALVGVAFLSLPVAPSAASAINSGSSPCTLDLFGPQFPLYNGGGRVGELLEAPSSP